VRKVFVLMSMFSLFAIIGCGSRSGPEPKGRLQTYPVTGKILVDGEPNLGITIYFFASDKLEERMVNPGSFGSQHYAVTDKDGSFKATTYSFGDGLPVGEWTLALFWVGKNPPPEKRFGEQMDDEVQIDPQAVVFSRKYGIPSKSELKVKVEKDKPVDMGTVELKSK